MPSCALRHGRQRLPYCPALVAGPHPRPESRRPPRIEPAMITEVPRIKPGPQVRIVSAGERSKFRGARPTICLSDGACYARIACTEGIGKACRTRTQLAFEGIVRSSQFGHDVGSRTRQPWLGSRMRAYGHAAAAEPVHLLSKHFRRVGTWRTGRLDGVPRKDRAHYPPDVFAVSGSSRCSSWYSKSVLTSQISCEAPCMFQTAIIAVSMEWS